MRCGRKATPHLKTKFRSAAQDTAEGAAEAASDPVEEPETLQGGRSYALSDHQAKRHRGAWVVHLVGVITGWYKKAPAAL